MLHLGILIGLLRHNLGARSFRLHAHARFGGHGMQAEFIVRSSVMLARAEMDRAVLGASLERGAPLGFALVTATAYQAAIGTSPQLSPLRVLLNPYSCPDRHAAFAR